MITSNSGYWWKSPSYLFCRRLGGPKSRSWHCGEMRNFLDLPRIDPILWALHPVTLLLYKIRLRLNVTLMPQMCSFEDGMYLFSTQTIVALQHLMRQAKMTDSKLWLQVVTPIKNPKLHCCQNLEFIYFYCCIHKVFILYYNKHKKVKYFVQINNILPLPWRRLVSFYKS